MRSFSSLHVLLEIPLLILGTALSWAGNQTSSVQITALGCIVLGLTGAHHLYLCMARREAFWSFCHILAAGLMLAYFGGAAVTLLLALTEIISFTSPRGLNFLSDTTLYIVLFCVALYMCGRIEVLFWGAIWAREEEEEHWSIWVTGALAFVVAAQAYCLATGKISYQGTGQLADGRSLPYAANLVIAFGTPLAGVCGWVLGRPELRRNRLLIATVVGAIPVQFLFNICFGRRIILVQILIGLVCFVWARRKGFTAKQVIVLGILAMPVVVASWYVFLAMRMDRYSDLVGQRRDIFERLNTTTELLRSNFDVVQKRQEENLVTRVFVIGFLSRIMAADRPNAFLLGRQLATETLLSVPRVILPGKHELVTALDAGEVGNNRNFGLYNIDQPESLITSAYADFGWAGLVTYPIVAMLIGIMFSMTARMSGSPMFRIFLVSSTQFTAFAVESMHVNLSLNAIRTLLVVGAVFAVAELLNRRARVYRPAPRNS
jgi:hypothetical protein